MPRHRIRSRSPSGDRRKRYDDPRERRRQRSPAPSGLLIRNLSLTGETEDLRAPFERFGPIKDVYLPKNYYTGEPRGFGFIKFHHPDDAADAKNHLDRAVIGGREIRIVFAEENRKTPQEMRKVTHTSSRRNRRRSRSFSPRMQHHAYSHSRSPSRDETRARDQRARDNYSPHKLRSVSRSGSPRHERRRSYKSREKSSKHSQSLSRSVSPRDGRKCRPSRRSRSPRASGHSSHISSMSPSLIRSPVRSRSQSRSHSPR